MPWSVYSFPIRQTSGGTWRRNRAHRMKTPDLIETLRLRFEKHPERHKGVPWATVQARLEASQSAVKSLIEMERTGGEPDVIAYDKKTGQVTFCDCSAESPTGRRSLCFDRKALDSRKENKPKGCASELAAEMGVNVLSEEQYRALQQLGEFDTKTSSWVNTPEDVRALGGALFCDRRYGKVFAYHNGAESYYAARGFRALLLI
jgi:hypothetical protein